MTRSKLQRIYVLLGILGVLCAAAFGVSRYEEHKENIKNSDEVILNIDTDSVTALSWKYGDGELSFHKEETWIYDEDAAFPVNEEKLKSLLEQFQEFGVSFRIENAENESQYGLDHPVCTITITTQEGIVRENEKTEGKSENKEKEIASDGTREYVIKLGNYSTMDEKRYVSIGDGNVYLVQHDPYEDYEITIRDMIKHDELPELNDVSKIQFEGIENYDIEFVEGSSNTYLEEDVYFTQGRPLDSSLVREYLNNISNLELSDYVNFKVSEEQLKEYGLDAPELTVTVDYTREDAEEGSVLDTFVLHVGRNQEEVEKARESKEEEAEYHVAAYARVGDSPIVYQLSSLNYSQLTEISYNDLRHKELLAASFDDITQMEITLENKEYTFTSEGKEEDKVWYYNGEETDITSLKSSIECIEADSFTDVLPSQKEEISLTVTLNLEKETVISVKLYRYDAQKCLAKVNGSTVSFVPRSDVVDLMEAVNAIVLN